MTEELKPCPCWQRDHNPCTCWQKNHRDGCPAQADKDTVTLKRSEVNKLILTIKEAHYLLFAGTKDGVNIHLETALKILETALKEGV